MYETLFPFWIANTAAVVYLWFVSIPAQYVAGCLAKRSDVFSSVYWINICFCFGPVLLLHSAFPWERPQALHKKLNMSEFVFMNSSKLYLPNHYLNFMLQLPWFWPVWLWSWFPQHHMSSLELTTSLPFLKTRPWPRNPIGSRLILLKNYVTRPTKLLWLAKPKTGVSTPVGWKLNDRNVHCDLHVAIYLMGNYSPFFPSPSHLLRITWKVPGTRGTYVNKIQRLKNS